MHPMQDNSLEALCLKVDKGFIIDLRLIVTLRIMHVCPSAVGKPRVYVCVRKGVCAVQVGKSYTRKALGRRAKARAVVP